MLKVVFLLCYFYFRRQTIYVDLFTYKSLISVVKIMKISHTNLAVSSRSVHSYYRRTTKC